MRLREDEMTIRRICQMCWIAKFESDGSPEDKFCPKCKKILGVGGGTPQSGQQDVTGRATPTGPKKSVSEVARMKPSDIDWSQLA